MHLATSLVEVVGKFEAKTDAATLAHAQRAVSRLHQSLHATETFKRVAQG